MGRYGQGNVIFTSPMARQMLAARRPWLLSARSVTHDTCARCATRDDRTAASVIVMAIRHMESRVEALERMIGPGIDQRLADAEEKRSLLWFSDPSTADLAD
jgi:hypothetical protein